MIYQMLLGMAIVSTVAIVLNKIAIYKYKARYWKENCFIAMEKYNNLLVEKQMGEAIEKVFDSNKLNVN